MAGDDRSDDPVLDPLFSYPQISSVLHPTSFPEAEAMASLIRGSSPAPRVGLSRPPPVASVQGGTGGGRVAGPASRTGSAAPHWVATDGQASASQKRLPSGKKKDDQVLLLAVNFK